MIKIFGVRILTKDDIGILNSNLDKCVKHIKKLEDEQEFLESIMSGLIEIIDDLQDEIDLLIKAQLDKSKKPKTKKKSKK